MPILAFLDYLATAKAIISNKGGGSYNLSFNLDMYYDMLPC